MTRSAARHPMLLVPVPGSLGQGFGCLLMALGMLAANRLVSGILAPGNNEDLSSLARQGVWQTQAMFVLGAGVALLGLVWPSGGLRHLVTILRLDPILSVVVLLCFCSPLWSASPDVSVRRTVALAMQILTAVAAVRYLDLRGVLGCIASFYAAHCALALILLVVAPHMVLMDHEGQRLLHGLMGHKNDFGRAASQGLVVCAAFVLLGRNGALWPLIGTGLCLAALVASWSKSGLAAAAAAVALGFLAAQFARRRTPLERGAPPRWSLRSWPIRPLIAVLVLVTMLIAGAVVVGSIDTSLTGRTFIWDYTINAGMRHPVLGYGYGGFWVGDLGPSGDLHDAVGWTILHAHNTWIDLFLDLGIVGAVLVGVWVIGFAVSWWLRLRSRASDPLDAAPGFVLLHQLALSMTGGAFFVHLNVNWFCWLSLVLAARLTWANIRPQVVR